MTDVPTRPTGRPKGPKRTLAVVETFTGELTHDEWVAQLAPVIAPLLARELIAMRAAAAADADTDDERSAS